MLSTFTGSNPLQMPSCMVTCPKLPRCAMVLGDVVSRDGLGLGRIGAPGYRAHSSVAMAPMFRGIRFGRHHFCSEV